MLQELFRIPGTNITLHGYGLMLVIGFLLAVQLARFLARRSRIDPEIFVNAGLLALISGVVGARLSHVLENLPQYTNPNRSFGENFWDAINVTSGGLTYYGGFLLATPALIAYAIYKRVPVRTGMDIIAPCLMIGLGIGRIGCFLNGCCYGAESTVPWGVKFPYYSNTYIEQYERKELTPDSAMYKEIWGKQILMTPDEVKKKYPGAEGERLLKAEQEKVHPVHPAQLYSTITALLLAALLTAYYTLPHVPGQVFALMCVLEGATRFLLEMLRVEPAVGGTPLSLSMWIGIGLVILGTVLWAAFKRAGGVNRGGEMVVAAA
jgi:phosphatidylglycerol:prolipoprotein diacylglycerol transferase